MECHSKYNVTQTRISLKMEYRLKIKCHIKWNVTQNEMSLKTKSHSKFKITEMEIHSNRMPLKIESHW